MFGFSPKLPISEEDRLWVDNGFDWLSRALGRQRLLQARVILPDAEHFPDPYDKSEAAAEKMFCRICGYMQVDRSQVELEIFPDETSELSNLMPYWRGGKGSGCAGLYMHLKMKPKRWLWPCGIRIWKTRLRPWPRWRTSLDT
jgi:hypothetical protein